MKFLGLRFDDVTMTDAVETLSRAAEGEEWRYAVTPNAAHFARLKGNDERLRQAYTEASFCLLDSRVVSFAAWLSGRRPPNVLPGSDLVSALFASRIRPDTTICIVGGNNQVVDALRSKYRLRHILHVDPPMGFYNKTAEIDQLVEFVVAARADYTFLVVGAPQQELLAHRILLAGGARGVGICAGASIEFLVGRQRRAPRLLQVFALEWAYRLWREPRRLGRRYLVESPQGILFVWRAGRSS